MRKRLPASHGQGEAAGHKRAADRHGGQACTVGIFEQNAVAGKPVDDQKIYTFATNNFVISQFERFFGLAPSAVKITPTDIIGRDILIEAIKAQPVINNHTEGRIIDLANKKEEVNYDIQ